MWLIQVSLLCVIELRQEFEGRVVELKVPGIADMTANEFTHPAANPTSLTKECRDETRPPQVFEWRVDRIKGEEGEVPVLSWFQPGKDCGIACRAITERGCERTAARKLEPEEAMVASETPTQSIDKHSDRDGFLSHGCMTLQGTISAGGQTS
jgi:hypothetical protein